MKKLLATLGALSAFFIAQNAWALCANYTTYASGQTLTAASLNSLQTNYTDCVNNVLDGDTITGTFNFQSAADINIYSDAGTTLEASIDGATGVAILSTRQLGESINCEINYSAGTITISGKDGGALSATNPCYVGIRSNTNGIVAQASFVANVTATDGATSQTDGNLFGITDANWANAMPMFFGVIYDGTTPYFTVSRKPHVVSGGAAGTLCQLTDTDCDAETDVMILTTGLTLASWVNLPITQVAWLSATYATTGGAWTFAESAYTGFNKLWRSVVSFTMPLAQNGAASGTYMLAGGFTAALFTSNDFEYYWSSENEITIVMQLDADPGTDGAGAVTADFSAPYTGVASASFGAFEMGMFFVTEVANGGHFCIGSPSDTLPTFSLAEAAGGLGQNGDFSNGARTVRGSLAYRVL